MNKNIFNQDYTISRNDREKKNKHNAFLILLTGLSGSGKSVVANHLDKKLFSESLHTYALDGDNIRLGICNDLGFSSEDRNENLRRVAEISKLMIDAGLITIAAFVSPYKKSRAMIKEIVGAHNYVEVYVSTSIEVCEKRDTKGLYAKARKGDIKDFTGISSPYEVPENADVIIDTDKISLEDSVNQIYNFIENKLSLSS